MTELPGYACHNMHIVSQMATCHATLCKAPWLRAVAYAVGDGDDETDVPTLSAEEAEKQCLALLDDMLADRLKKAAGKLQSIANECGDRAES